MYNHWGVIHANAICTWVEIEKFPPSLFYSDPNQGFARTYLGHAGFKDIIGQFLPPVTESQPVTRKDFVASTYRFGQLFLLDPN